MWDAANPQPLEAVLLGDVPPCQNLCAQLGQEQPPSTTARVALGLSGTASATCHETDGPANLLGATGHAGSELGHIAQALCRGGL